jgi:hypothetical protein
VLDVEVSVLTAEVMKIGILFHKKLLTEIGASRMKIYIFTVFLASRIVLYALNKVHVFRIQTKDFSPSGGNKRFVLRTLQ